MLSCFEALESTKISLYEPVSSEKYENGYRAKICDFSIFKAVIFCAIEHTVFLSVHCRIRVRRKDIVADSFAIMKLTSEELQMNKLEVSFVGEKGYAFKNCLVFFFFLRGCVVRPAVIDLFF